MRMLCADIAYELYLNRFRYFIQQCNDDNDVPSS